MTELETYYNKFNEDKRLLTRYGQVEFQTSMLYIRSCLDRLMEERGLSDKGDLKILDVGAGTGRYSLSLAKDGYDVTAVELVKYNLGILKQKAKREELSITAFQGNACKLKRIADASMDLTLVFGPMYHLFGREDKVKALGEAKRVTRPGGYILVAYCMNEYCVLTYAFKEGHLGECLEENRLTADFHSISSPEHLYDYVRIEDIDEVNAAVGLTREKIISPDGAANYMRPTLNAMSEEEFSWFMKYHLSTCERMDLIGAGAHTLDLLRVPKESET